MLNISILMLIIFFQTSFMLLLLLLAKGWAVTRMELTWKPLVFATWFCYGVVHILLYVWNMVIYCLLFYLPFVISFAISLNLFDVIYFFTDRS